MQTETNLFLNAEARDMFFKEAKTVIVKDYSANKCGVVTSSCDVTASMLLSEKEFLECKRL
jgi:glutamate dehydrogenase